MGRPLPRAGVFAHARGDVVAQHMALASTGRGSPKRFDGASACFIETGDGRAGMGQGDSFAEPLPDVKLRAPSRLWHGAKVLYARDWLASRF
jgi:sulfide:quinone oxidoreductase